MTVYTIIFLAVLGAICAFLLARNEAVYRTRIKFIDADDFPSAYRALPDYHPMVANPRYFLLWTEAHWRAWLERQQQTEVSQ